MKQQCLAILILGLMAAAGTAHGDWKMRIHSGASVDEWYVGDIDSITFYDDTLSIPGMVALPAGTYAMGDGYGYCGFDIHDVTLTHAIFFGTHEVTNQEFLEAVQWAYDQGYVTASTVSVRDNLDGSTVEVLDLDDPDCLLAFSGGIFTLRDPGDGVKPDHPVVEVSWYGAVSYCDWLSLREGYARAYDHSSWLCGGGYPYGAEGYRLPTDAEWEYGGQYNDGRIWPTGSNIPTCAQMNYLSDDSMCVGYTTPVGTYGPAPESIGLYDMGGNVLEWVNDWYTCYLGLDPVTDPTGPVLTSSRTCRGGSFANGQTWVRRSDRRGNSPDYASDRAGFRIVRTQ